jgi:hypothetical protein
MQKPTKILAHGYTKVEGRKGDNNIASLVMNALNNIRWIKADHTGKQLSIIMDNCGGEKKNKYMLRLAF